jgi:CubicO group peptidase (beta-lactamase class C family)
MQLARLSVVFAVACSSQAASQEAPAPTPKSKPAAYAGVAAAVERGDAPKTTSVLVMRGGAIEYERYFDDATAQTLHDTRSASKSLTSLAVGIAIDRGLLPGLDARAFSFLGDLRPFAGENAAKHAITIADFFTMSSALDCNDDSEASPGNEENMYPKPVWARWAVDIATRTDYARDASGRGPWHYCTAGVVLLGQILERVAKQPIDKFMAEHLFAPLGIERWQFSRSPANEAMPAGGLRLSSRDLAKVAWLVRSGGAWHGKQVVPAAYVKAATTVHRTTPYEQDYGLLFWRRTYRTPCGTANGWFMSGNGGNHIVIFAELDAVVVVTRTNYNTKGMHQQTTALIEGAVLPELACPR